MESGARLIFDDHVGAKTFSATFVTATPFPLVLLLTGEDEGGSTKITSVIAAANSGAEAARVALQHHAAWREGIEQPAGSRQRAVGSNQKA